MDPGFDEIEEEMDNVYAEVSWSRYIEKAKLEEDAGLEFIEKMGIDPALLKDSYLDFLRFPDVEIVTGVFEKPDLEGVKEEITKVMDFLITAIPVTRPEKGWDGLQDIILKSTNLISSGYFDTEARTIELLNRLSRNVKVVQNRWPEGGGKEYLAKFERLQEEAIRPALKSWQEYIHKPLADFIKTGAEPYRDWRRDHSILNFGDLLTGTVGLLRDNPEVRNYFKKRYTHMLVDEFQDTDPVQAEIILFLTGTDTGERNWRNIIPSPGSLFVVGDPKQSIYRFRRADIDIYNLVKKIFSGKDGEVLTLYSNFRSLPFMQETMKDVFKEILPDKETKYQARYFPLNTVKTINKDCNSGVMENPISKVYRDNASEIAKIDAAKIANWIKGAVNGGIMLQNDKGEPVRPRYSDFLILTRFKKNLRLYAKSLELLGIPYDVSGGESFSVSLELNEIFRLFKAIEDERDTVALITTLRGMFFGISDRDLYRFKKAGGRFSYYSEVPGGFDEFGRAFKMLISFKKMVNNYEPAVAAAMIIEKLGIVPFSICKEEGLTRAGNIFKALELLRERKNGRLDTFSGLVSDLAEFLKTGGIESMSLISSEESSVRIMNLHKAKGLEAPVVMLADPMGAGGDYDPGHHITRTGDGKASGYFTITVPSGSYSNTTIAIPPDWDKKMEEEKQYEEAEKKRLEYVAVTRAKNILVVSTYRDGSRRKAWEFMHDYLAGKSKIEASEELDGSEREMLEVSKDEWKKVGKDINESLEKIKGASYGLINVTTEAKKGIIFTESAGQGMSWGRIVHKAVELVCKGGYESLEVLGRAWIEEEGRNEGDLEKLIGVVDGFMESGMYGRIERAEEKYFEVPFALEEDGSIVYGVIDAVFREGDAWVIVDYKTDDFEKDEERKRAYEKQVEMYVKYWERISRERVKEEVLFKL